MTTKDLINFDKHGRPRTPEEIADIQADASIAFDEHGNVRTVEEIAAIKFLRMLGRNPEYLDWFRQKEEALREKEDHFDNYTTRVVKELSVPAYK